MSTRAFYHPRNLDIDLANCPPWLYREIVSLHGHIRRKDPPVLSCSGNGDPMYIVHGEAGRYFARHYPGSNTDGHSHYIGNGMSDEHRRQAEYSQRAAEKAGLAATLERSTGNGTRLDVAIVGDVNVGIEIQRSELSRAKAKTRTTKSFQAGWSTAWVTDRERDPDWADHVPTARLTVREDGNLFSRGVPPPNTARVSIGKFTRERDRSRPTGWRYMRQPHAVLLDELAALMPAGEIVPVRVGKMGGVSLAFKDAVDVLDSCTYVGASAWNPVTDTPRQKEAPQEFSRTCHHPPTSARQVELARLWNTENATESRVSVPSVESMPVGPPGPHGSIQHQDAWCWTCRRYGHFMPKGTSSDG